MASESRDPTSLTVSLPPDLQQWLDRQATALDVDEETVLLRLLSAYRDASGLDEPAAESPSREAIEPVVRDVLTDRLPDLSDAVAEQVASDLREELVPELDSDTDFEARIDDLEADYKDTLDDVRQRVVQVKREADGKAPQQELDATIERIDDLEATLAAVDDATDRLDAHDDHLDELEETLDGVESRLTALESEGDDELAEQLSDAQEKLKTVAWVVRDLRETVQGDGTAAATVEQIKRRAATEDVSRAGCENCGKGVEIGLLTEPACPHCDATLADVEPSKRPFGFGSATLTVAAGLEAGADGSDELDDISTVQRGDRT